MNYLKLYNTIVQNRQAYPYTGYVEKHHIVPKCMGGSDSITNIVELSAREHFICHVLLHKVYPNNSKLLHSVVLMCKQINSKYSSRVYKKLREEFSIAQSAAQTGELNSQFGTKWIYSIELEICKKIKQAEPIPAGFSLGRVMDFKKLKEVKVTKREQAAIKNKSLYTELYNLYNELGWDQFRVITGYDKSKQNLVQMCAKYVKEFIPQNGKTRG